MQIKTKAVVLKASDYNENDRLLALLTEELGVVYAYAPGARKMNSRLSSVSSVLVYGEFVLFKNRDKYTVDSAESERIFYDIRKDLDLLAYASYFAELTLGVTTEEENSGETLRLFLNTVHFLEKGKDPVILKAIYELRLMSSIGFAPSLIACDGCGEFEKDMFWFDPREGKALCTDCKPRGTGDDMPLSGSAFMAARHIVYAPIEQLFSFSVGERARNELALAAERYCICQTDKVFPTLEFLNSIRSF